MFLGQGSFGEINPSRITEIPENRGVSTARRGENSVGVFAVESKEVKCRET